MKLATLLFYMLWMLLMLLSELNVCASARKQLPSQDTCDKCALLVDANTREVINTRALHSEGAILGNFKDHGNIHQHKKSRRRTLYQKNVFQGKKGRWLAVDEVDYAGPRTHPPTKPPRN